MNIIKITAFFILILASLSFVNAALSSEDKKDIQENLEKYKTDANKMTLFLAVVNAKMDLSQESELRQQLTDAGTGLGIDMSRFQNIAQGTVPYAVQQEQIEATTTTLSVGNAQTQLEGVQQADNAPTTQTQTAGGYTTMLVTVLVVLVVALVLIAWIFGKRKAK